MAKDRQLAGMRSMGDMGGRKRSGPEEQGIDRMRHRPGLDILKR